MADENKLWSVSYYTVNRLRSLLLLIIFVAISVVLQVACDASNRSGRDSQLESQLTRTLNETKKNNFDSIIDLNKLFSKPWMKACFQSPYSDQAQFENSIGVKVDDYEYVADDFYVLWVFYQDTSQKWAKLHRIKVMDRDATSGRSCTDLHSPWLYVVKSNGKLQYHF